MKKLFVIAVLTLLTSTAWADQNADGGAYNPDHKHMTGDVNCGHTHPMGVASDNSESSTPTDGE